MLCFLQPRDAAVFGEAGDAGVGVDGYVEVALGGGGGAFPEDLADALVVFVEDEGAFALVEGDVVFAVGDGAGFAFADEEGLVGFAGGAGDLDRRAVDVDEFALGLGESAVDAEADLQRDAEDHAGDDEEEVAHGGDLMGRKEDAGVEGRREKRGAGRREGAALQCGTADRRGTG